MQRAPFALLADQWEERKKSRSYNDTRTVSIEKFGPHSAVDSRSWNFEEEEARLAPAYMERCQSELKRRDHWRGW